MQKDILDILKNVLLITRSIIEIETQNIHIATESVKCTFDLPGVPLDQESLQYKPNSGNETHEHVISDE